MWSQNNSSPVFSAICLLQNKNKQIIFYRHLHLENEWLHLVRVRYLMNRTVQMTFLSPSYRHVVYERTRRSPLDYSLSSKHRCEASVSMRHSITNELFHPAIFRYMFAKKQKRGQDDGGYTARCQWTSQRDSVRLHTTQLRIKSSNLPCSTKAK